MRRSRRVYKCGCCAVEVPHDRCFPGIGPNGMDLCIGCVPRRIQDLELKISQMNDSIGNSVIDNYRGYEIIISDGGQFGFNNPADKVNVKEREFFYCHYKDVSEVRSVIDKIFGIVSKCR